MSYQQALSDGEEGDDDRRLGVVRRTTDRSPAARSAARIPGGEEQGPEVLLSR
jgi:hypothetical protein